MALRIESIVSAGQRHFQAARGRCAGHAVRPAVRRPSTTAPGRVPADPVFTMQALQHMSAHPRRSLEQLLDSMLQGWPGVRLHELDVGVGRRGTNVR
jgi:hypothetical protein